MESDDIHIESARLGQEAREHNVFRKLAECDPLSRAVVCEPTNHAFREAALQMTFDYLEHGKLWDAMLQTAKPQAVWHAIRKRG
jgi:hypothetical protein